MSVAGGIFQPRAPLVPAEETVDWIRVNRHVLQRREEIEAALLPHARRLGYLVGEGISAPAIRKQLARRFASELRASFDLGTRSVRKELAALRARESTPS
jgi:hypothetical protein